MTDFELLNDYACNHSEQAFGTLVERYANLVFSAALRQVQNAHDAEEIAQAVFIILARKAGTLGKDIILSGWLLRTTRFVVMNARRRQFHRSRAELEAASLQLCETENAWHQIAPLIDEALVSLNETDRNALTLRFFEEKSFKEIGALLHLSDDAAQKRVSRALGRLRDAFTRRGVVLPAALVSAAMATKAVQAAPSHLLALIPSGVNAGTGQAMLLAESALRALERMRLRTFGLCTTGMTLILLLLLALVHQLRSRDSSAVRPLPRAEAPVSGPPAATPPVRPATGIQAPIPSTRRQLLVRVLDADSGSPLAKTQVTSIWSAFPEGSTNVFQTDAKGEALLSFPSSSERVWCLRITALKDGFVPRFVNWAAERGDLLEELPAEYNLGLAGGLTMGGVVVDEGGQPAPEVTVTLNAGVDKTIIESSPEREGLTFTHVEVTDAQGRWVCNHAPQSIAALRCRVSHPDFVAADYPCSALGTTSNGLLRLSERDFRSQSAVMVLKAGAVLSGVVLDDQGNPVPGAKVTQNRDWGNVEANQFTRADGSFRFGNLGEGPWVVTAQADGFMGTDQTVPVGKQAEPCRFVLERAGRLQGRVEDDLGNPIANASLYATESSDRERFESVICTDAAGRFEWRSAPLTPCRYNIDAYGFKSRRAELLVPDGTERIVVLERAPIPRPARISGTVLDAETHQPIRSFEVWSAVTYRQQFASGSSQSVGMASELKTTGTNGTFAFLLLARGRSVESCDVEIKANGYLPGRETIRGSGTNGAHVTLALKPKVNLAGSVKLPNGEPVAGTVVLLCAEETSDLAYMRRPGQFDLKLSRGPHAET
ncbi:MAG TPA: sigma-70 family RNA polymerase sigma factor, partial [Bacillota bacterium]|nr:sigma-70 family RNA polymerase sigma factor [Bacillota bacterium]